MFCASSYDVCLIECCCPRQAVFGRWASRWNGKKVCTPWCCSMLQSVSLFSSEYSLFCTVLQLIILRLFFQYFFFVFYFESTSVWSSNQNQSTLMLGSGYKLTYPIFRFPWCQFGLLSCSGSCSLVLIIAFWVHSDCSPSSLSWFHRHVDLLQLHGIMIHSFSTDNSCPIILQ